MLLVLRALLVDGSEASPVVGRHMYGSKALVRSRGGSGNGSSTQLKNLTVIGGVLSPAFAPATLAYNLTVPNGTSVVDLSATAVSNTSNVSIQGHSAPATKTAPISLTNLTSFAVVVSDTSGSTTYTIAFVGAAPAPAPGPGR